MVRRHGWQLPAHTLQVAAMTVFFLLAVAYYIFLAPFLWFTAMVYAAYAVYSPLALAVVLLYIRCTAIDPADSGVLAHQELMHHHKEDNNEKNSADSSLGVDPGFSLSLQPSAPSSAATSIRDVLAQKESPLEEGQVEHVHRRRPKVCSFSGLCGFCCYWAVAPDNCWKPPNPVQDEMLFCTLCNTEVPMYSKHCRSCDKCVDGFDHHCLWLNNCIGRKNYRTFVALMTTSLMLLLMECLVGGAVFVRCFVDTQGIESQITEKLGNGFSRAPFATVVAVCTLVAILACLPLGELFSFHLILIKKGMTTYEYVMAVRAHDSGASTDGDPSGTSSSSTSTNPVMSRSNSLGQQHGGWCTPPRIFVEHQDEVIPHPGSRTASSTGRPERPNPAQKGKPDVRISAWRLAKIGKEEAVLAASKARKASSVLRPVGPAQDLKGLTESEESYSSNSSRQSSVSIESGLPHSILRRGGKEDIKGSMSLSPYKLELPRIKTGREQDTPLSWSKRLRLDTKSSGSLSRTNLSTSVPSTQFNTPLRPDQLSRSTSSGLTPVQDSNVPASSQSQPAVPPAGSLARPDLTRVTTVSDGYDASGGETTDDMGRRAMKGKKIRGSTKFLQSDLKNPVFFKSRGTSRYGGGGASRAIQFKGRGISTSVLSPYEGGPSNWRDPVTSSPSSGSDGGKTATMADTGQYPKLRIPSLASRAVVPPMPKDSSIPRHSSSMQLRGQVSIFFSSPLMPIGESAAGRRHQTSRPDLLPKPPVIPRYSSLGTSFIRSSPPEQVPHTQALPSGSGQHSKEPSTSTSSLPRPEL